MSDIVLVVDDTPVNLKLLSAILKRDGLDPIGATNGEQALEVARQKLPDLILLDVMMPGKDGFTVCAELKGDSATADIPIIFLSAMGEVEDKLKGLGLGAADYITKPFDGAEVLARVHTQLRLRRLNQSLAEANRELSEKQKALEEDLRSAAVVQRALIPRPQLSVPGLNLAWLFEPCSAIGGDIFNVIPLDEGHVALYMLDVSGHGVPPAMIAVLASQSLTPQAGLVMRRGEGGALPCVRAPVDVLVALDREYPLSRFDRYFTISYLVLEVGSGLLRYSSAGHPPPALLTRNGGQRLLEEGGAIIGLGDERYDPGEVLMEPGDRVFLYTDGISEFEGPGGALFGVTRFREVLEQARGGSLQEACDSVRRALDAFGEGAPSKDDVSLLAVEYVGLAPC